MEESIFRHTSHLFYGVIQSFFNINNGFDRLLQFSADLIHKLAAVS